MQDADFSLNLFPFSFRVKTNSQVVIDNIRHLYQGVAESTGEQIHDYTVSVMNANGMRRFIRKQAHFFSDVTEPFKPLPYEHSYAFLEWGMNWTIAANEMQHVVVHSAVLAKNNSAILFPAPPGSGKSTLTTYLAFNDWRLLSDEMALIKPYSQIVEPFVRPICLKNNSITLARSWFPNGNFSSLASNTHKGNVCHLSPPKLSWDNNRVPAVIKGVVFPKYDPSSTGLEIYQLNQSQAFMSFAENAFNFGLIGEVGFKTLIQIIEQVPCFEIYYSDLFEVACFLDEDVL